MTNKIIKKGRSCFNYQGKNCPYRHDFLNFLPKFSIGAELGVFKGEFSKLILQYVKPQELHLIDVWWTKHGERYPDLGRYTNYGNLKTRDAFNNVKRIINQYDTQQCAIIHVADDLECLATFPNQYFDWVYIDTTHKYEHTRGELEILKNKIKTGGIICGHDWEKDSNHKNYGVYKAIAEFCIKYRWEVVCLDNHSQWAIQQIC